MPSSDPREITIETFSIWLTSRRDAAARLRDAGDAGRKAGRPATARPAATPANANRYRFDDALKQFRRGASFRVQEFAVLADGRRLPLGDERGFGGNTHVMGCSEPVDPWLFQTLERLEADVRTTVLPDDDETDDEHPWAWLAERLHSHGVDAGAEQLKQLPYDVVFSQRLLARAWRSPSSGFRIEATCPAPTRGGDCHTGKRR